MAQDAGGDPIVDGNAGIDGGNSGGIDASVDAASPPRNDAGVDGGSGDGDGDGVLDSTDNCPAIRNPDQHNEDGDQAGDPCDPCPQVANAVSDGDGDAIPDACDPRPSTPGDVLVRFESFAGSGGLPADWQARGAGVPEDWTRNNDTLTVVAGETRIAIVDAGSTRHTIDIGLDVASASSTGLVFVTGLADARADIQEFFGCGMRFDAGTGGRTRELFRLETMGGGRFTTLKTDATDTPVVPGTYRIQFGVAGNNEVCVIPEAANLHRLEDSARSNNNTFVGLRVNNVTASFRYVAIYTF